MNNDDARSSDAARRNAFDEDGESTASSGIAVLPISWASDNFCQAPANTQYALYLLACQQAKVVVRAVRRRRQLLFARGVHLGN
jgi:hypothetical protein